MVVLWMVTLGARADCLAQGPMLPKGWSWIQLHFVHVFNGLGTKVLNCL
jgi:hypothetical protein